MAPKNLSLSLKSISKITLPHWSCYPTPIPFHLPNTTFGRMFYTAPDEEEENGRPVDTSKMDVNTQPLMGLHGYDFKRILFCSKYGFWHHKLRLDRETRSHSYIINLDVGTQFTGVSLWKEGMESIKLLKTFPTENMNSALNELMRHYKPYGFVIGYPVGPDGGRTPKNFDQSHVNHFLFNLDSCFDFSGIPICLVNEYGTTKVNKEEVKELVERDRATWTGPGPFISTENQHRNALSARNQLIKFLEKVAPQYVPLLCSNQ